MTQKRQDIFRKIMWFGNRQKFDIDFFDLLQPQREVSNDSRYNSGLFFSDKCGRNIQHESGTELKFIKQLENSKKVKFYYDQPCKIPYWRGRIKDEWTPDFGIYLTSGEFVIVEVKELRDMLDHKVQMKVEGTLKFCRQRGFGFLLTDGKHTIDRIKQVKCNRKLEKEILQVLDEHILRRYQWTEILKKHEATHRDLLKIIMKNNLKYSSKSGKLQHGNKNEIFRKVFIEKKRYDDVMTEKYNTLFGSCLKQTGKNYSLPVKKINMV